ncbi:MAG: hypothetical protein R2730_14415 [Chitinophagales bacterium]
MSTGLKKKNIRTERIIWGIALFLWSMLTLGMIVDYHQNGKTPADCATYFHALEQYSKQLSPYNTIEASQAQWMSIHHLEEQVLSGSIDEFPGEKISGPFLYPPTLLQLMQFLHLTPIGFLIGLLISLVLFSWLWIRLNKLSVWWLLFFLFSWDILASFTLGNIEIILLTCTLITAYGIYTKRVVRVAPLIAFIGLVKPFYVLFFVAFGLLLLANNDEDRTKNGRSMIPGAGVTLLLLIMGWLLWPGWIRPDVIDFLSNGTAHSWYILPLADQTPMSIWNRTFMQGLVSVGISASIAQICSLIAWCILTLISIRLVWNKHLPFSILFAFSLLLFYWFRPVGWSLIFLDVIVLSAIWPYTGSLQKRALLSVGILFALTHWLALIKTGELEWLRLVTLQSATFPWETWFVFPAAFLLLFWITYQQAMKRLTDISNSK